MRRVVVRAVVRVAAARAAVRAVAKVVVVPIAQHSACRRRPQAARGPRDFQHPASKSQVAVVLKEGHRAAVKRVPAARTPRLTPVAERPAVDRPAKACSRGPAVQVAARKPRPATADPVAVRQVLQDRAVVLRARADHRARPAAVSQAVRRVSQPDQPVNQVVWPVRRARRVSQAAQQGHPARRVNPVERLEHPVRQEETLAAARLPMQPAQPGPTAAVASRAVPPEQPARLVEWATAQVPPEVSPVSKAVADLRGVAARVLNLAVARVAAVPRAQLVVRRPEVHLPRWAAVPPEQRVVQRPRRAAAQQAVQVSQVPQPTVRAARREQPRRTAVAVNLAVLPVLPVAAARPAPVNNPLVDRRVQLAHPWAPARRTGLPVRMEQQLVPAAPVPQVLREAPTAQAVMPRRKWVVQRVAEVQRAVNRMVAPARPHLQAEAVKPAKPTVLRAVAARVAVRLHPLAAVPAVTARTARATVITPEPDRPAVPMVPRAKAMANQAKVDRTSPCPCCCPARRFRFLHLPGCQVAVLAAGARVVPVVVLPGRVRQMAPALPVAAGAVVVQAAAR